MSADSDRVDDGGSDIKRVTKIPTETMNVEINKNNGKY